VSNDLAPGQESKVSARMVRDIIRQGWAAEHALAATDSSAPTPLWQQQLVAEGWNVTARLFGDWARCMGGDAAAEAEWLRVASAAAFCQTGMMWAREMLHTGSPALGRELLLAVEAAGREVRARCCRHGVQHSSQARRPVLTVHTAAWHASCGCLTRLQPPAPGRCCVQCMLRKKAFGTAHLHREPQ
jgi:hypothetical protein